MGLARKARWKLEREPKLIQDDNFAGLSQQCGTTVAKKDIVGSITTPSTTPKARKRKKWNKKKRQQWNSPRSSPKDRMNMNRKRRERKQSSPIISSLRTEP